MARLDRLSYRASTQARLYTRLRQLVVLFLTIIVGVLLSVSVNAQKTSEKKKAKIYKFKNWTKVNHYANACQILEKKRTHWPKGNSRLSRIAKKSKPLTPVTTSVISKADLPLSRIQQSIIREMVALDLSERKDLQPIELAPLSFKLQEDKFKADDINPLLIAIEFALQGRTIVIDSQLVKVIDQKGNYHYNLVEEIKKVMKEMGVPDERISFSQQAILTQTSDEPQNQMVHFTAF